MRSSSSLDKEGVPGAVSKFALDECRVLTGHSRLGGQEGM